MNRSDESTFQVLAQTVRALRDTRDHLDYPFRQDIMRDVRKEFDESLHHMENAMRESFHIAYPDRSK